VAVGSVAGLQHGDLGERKIVISVMFTFVGVVLAVC
jgi:hypothetical protein